MNPIDQLGLFAHKVEELRSTRLIRFGFSAGFSVSYERMRGVNFSSREPEEEDLRSFLLTFRQFMADREPVFLHTIYNICYQRLTDERFKRLLAEARQIWKDYLKQGGFKLVWNERKVAPEKIFDLWINGVYFHNDAEKRVFLTRIAPHEQSLLRNVFLDFLIEGTRQVLYVGNIVRIALREGLISA